MNETFHGGMGPGGPGGRGPGGGFGPPGGFQPGELRRPGGSDSRGGRGFAGRGPGGPGFGGGGVKLDPLVALDDSRTPLRGKLLAVPGLRAKYLRCVRTIAETSLDWKKLGPVVAQCRKLIEPEVKADTRKLSSFEAFEQSTADEVGDGRGGASTLRSFAEQRRAFLLDYHEIDHARTGEANRALQESTPRFSRGGSKDEDARLLCSDTDDKDKDGKSETNCQGRCGGC